MPFELMESKKNKREVELPPELEPLQVHHHPPFFNRNIFKLTVHLTEMNAEESFFLFGHQRNGRRLLKIVEKQWTPDTNTSDTPRPL